MGYLSTELIVCLKSPHNEQFASPALIVNKSRQYKDMKKAQTQVTLILTLSQKQIILCVI